MDRPARLATTTAVGRGDKKSGIGSRRDELNVVTREPFRRAVRFAPAMSQIYAAYLGRFIDRPDVSDFLISTVQRLLCVV